MKRALRCDKTTIAALGAVLKLYADTDSLPQKLPALRLLTRPGAEIKSQAERLAPMVQTALGASTAVTVISVKSQIGSGALPVDLLPSFALRLCPAGKSSGKKLAALAAAFRNLPVPVIGRIHDGALVFDLRCLEDEAAFIDQLPLLPTP